MDGADRPGLGRGGLLIQKTGAGRKKDGLTVCRGCCRHLIDESVDGIDEVGEQRSSGDGLSSTVAQEVPAVPPWCHLAICGRSYR